MRRNNVSLWLPPHLLDQLRRIAEHEETIVSLGVV